MAWGFDRWQGVQAIRKGAVVDTESPACGTFDGSQAKQEPASIIVGELQAGRYDQAAQLYLALDSPAKRLAVAPEAVLAIGDHLLAQQRTTQALEVFRRFVAERPASVQIDHAYLGAGQAMLRQPRGQLSARQYFLAAIDTATSAETSRTAREYLRRLDAGEHN
jgi:outer membrane protein assembly factor BamD (BamD/ComL family)